MGLWSSVLEVRISCVLYKVFMPVNPAKREETPARDAKDYFPAQRGGQGRFHRKEVKGNMGVLSEDA